MTACATMATMMQRLSIRDVPADLWRAVKVYCAGNGITLREFVIQALWMKLEKGGKH